MGGRHGIGKVRQGWAYRVLRTESRVKVRMENRNVMDTQQGRVLEMNMGQGGTGIGVPIWCCMEFNRWITRAINNGDVKWGCGHRMCNLTL